MIALFENDEREKMTGAGDTLAYKMDAFLREIFDEYQDYKKRDIGNICHQCVTEACLTALLKIECDAMKGNSK